MGGAAYERGRRQLSAWQKHSQPENCFLLPHEVFELGLGQGALLVYLWLVYHKQLRHGADRSSYASIGKEVGLCEKTVQTHLRTLANIGLIRLEDAGKSFSYTLSPIRDYVQDRYEDLFPTQERGLSA